MAPDASALRAQIAAGMNAAQQGLFDLCRSPMRETGRSLHLAAFSAACLAMHHAAVAEADLADVLPLAEREIREMAAEWDARPAARAHRPLLARLFQPVETIAVPALLSTERLFESIPGTEHPHPGDRGTYVVARCRHYLSTVFAYSCRGAHVGTWDADGRGGALDRALVADLYTPEDGPALTDGPGVFYAVIERLAAGKAITA